MTQLTGTAPATAVSSTTAGTEARISIFNFDPVEQSKLWLQLGPVEARRVLVGVLRTALLFGGTVVVDRNQLLEGVFFMSMPPDRLAWHLGLEPGAALPLEVQLLGSGRVACEAPGPWELGPGIRSWGVAQDVVEQIEANARAVRNADRVSSPIIALTGGRDDVAVTDNGRDGHSSSGGRPDEGWKTSDTVVIPQFLWDRSKADKEQVAKTVREAGQRAWVEEMRSGRVPVRPGGNLGPNPIGPELSVELPPGADRNPVVGQLLDALTKLEYADPARGSECGGRHPGEEGPCRRRHVTTRSLLTRWLDGETVQDLKPPKMDASLTDQDLAVHRSSALGWWTLAYNRAICSRDGLRLLTIFNALPSPSGVAGPEAADAELAWGLSRPEPPIGERLRARLRVGARRRRTGSAPRTTVPIIGDVVSRLAAFTPAEYMRLQAFDAVGSGELLRRPSRRSLFDLVVAIDEISGDTSSRSRRIRATVIRSAIFSAGGLAVVLYESGMLALSGPVWSAMAVGAAALLAAPWADFGALRRMSGSKLQSTLRINHDVA